MLRSLLLWVLRKHRRRWLLNIWDIVAKETGHCANCWHADELVVIRGVWPLCIDCASRYLAGEFDQDAD
jgi:hypothetical protein